MANYLLVHHKVRDYNAWKQTYDKDRGRRADTGLNELRLMHNPDDRNEIYILFEARDPKRARAFGESPELKEVMQKAGVLEYTFHFLQD